MYNDKEYSIRSNSFDKSLNKTMLCAYFIQEQNEKDSGYN